MGTLVLGVVVSMYATFAIEHTKVYTFGPRVYVTSKIEGTKKARRIPHGIGDR